MPKEFRTGIDQEAKTANLQPHSSTDRDLLFARLAMHNGFVDQERLADAYQYQASNQGRSLADILVHLSVLSDETRRILESILEHHVRKHDDDPLQSLSAFNEQSTLVRGSTDPDDTITFVPAKALDHQRHERFGDYELISEIARGGMGVVYKARQIKLNRLVALKRIRAGELADDAQVKRFYGEAEAAAKLDHPGIVTVYEVGEANGEHFFSMALVVGQSLNERVKKDGPLPPKEAALVLKTVVEAVEFAHERGIVHRDIKPQNILLDESGQARLTDFGLAKQVRGETDLTISGQILGTPSYMPPEQASGNLAAIGPCSDVYSLGATLYYVLTGRPPFQTASVAETLKQVLDVEPVPLRRLNQAIPQDLETICLKCLLKQPDHRYKSARDLAEELQRFLDDLPILARPAGNVERTVRWCIRNPWIAGLLAAVMVSLLGGALVSSIFAIVARYSESRAIRAAAYADQKKSEAEAAAIAAGIAEKSAEQQKRNAEEQRDLSQGRLYIADIQLADRARREQQLLEMQSRLESHLPNGGVDRRGWEWFYLRSKVCDEEFVYFGHDAHVDSLAWHPDGNQIASSSFDGAVKVWLNGTGVEVASCQSAGGQSYDITWNKPGSRLLGVPTKTVLEGNKASLAKIAVWDPYTKSIDVTLPGRTAQWSPDGQRLAIVSLSGGVSIWQLGTRDVKILPAWKKKAVGLVWSPVDNRIAVFDQTSAIHIIDPESGTTRVSLSGDAKDIRAIAYRPDGRALAGAVNDGIRIWDTDEGKELRHIADKNNNIVKLDWHPNSTMIAALDKPFDTGINSKVQIWNSNNGDLRFRFPSSCFAWSPKGENIAVTDDAGRTIEIVAISLSPNEVEKAESRKLRAHTNRIYALAWSKDGDRLATGSADVTVRVWNAKPLTTPLRWARAPLAWRPKTRQLAAFVPPKVCVFDFEHGRTLAEFDAPRTDVDCLAWDSQGIRLFIGMHRSNGKSKSAEIAIWNAATQKVDRRIETAQVSMIAVSPDDRQLVTIGRRYSEPIAVEIHEIERNAEPTRLVMKSHATSTFVLAEHADRIAYHTMDYKNPKTSQVRLIDVDSGGDNALEIEDANQVCCLALDRKSARLAVAKWKENLQTNEISVWDLSTTSRSLAMHAHDGRTTAIVFHPQEPRLVTFGGRTAVLWDLVTGQELLRLDKDNLDTFEAVWSDDGWILAGSEYGTTNFEVWNSSKGRDRAKTLPRKYFRTDLLPGGVF